MPKDKLICNCNRTMPLDGKAVARALKVDAPFSVNTELCRKHLSTFEAAVKNGNDLVVACTQEAPLFSELHGELKGSGSIQFVNIRETAGWSAEGKDATPKIAALLALVDLPEPEPVPVVSYKSSGNLLIRGCPMHTPTLVVRKKLRPHANQARDKSGRGPSPPHVEE